MPDNDSKLEVADFRRMAKEIDSTGQATISEPKESADKSKSRDDTGQEDGQQENENQNEPTQDELAAKDKEQKSSEISDDEPLVDDEELAQKEKEKAEKAEREVERKAKEKTRLEKNWDNMQKRQSELDKKEQELSQREKQQTKRGDLTEEKDERGYSVKDYQFAINHFKSEGRDDLAQNAEAAARELYTKLFLREWNSNLAELTEKDPDLANPNSEISKAAASVLSNIPLLRQIPDGCKYALRIAKGDTSASLVSELQAENKKLKEEVDKLNKATRIGVGGPAKMAEASGKSFDSMSKEERKKHLHHQAALADAGALSDE